MKVKLMLGRMWQYHIEGVIKLIRFGVYYRPYVWSDSLRIYYQMFKKKLDVVTTSCTKVPKHVKKEQAISGVWETFKGYLTNIAYGFEGIKASSPFDSPPSLQTKHNTNLRLFIFGCQYETLEDCKRAHQEIIWFTYRKNYRIQSGLHSDVGWGCLIRVAQMTMARALSKYFKLNNKKVQKNYIITAFLEEQSINIKYSLNKFVEKGHKLWAIKAGQWYSMTQITTVLQALHEEAPLKGSQNLKVKVFNEIIDLQQLISTFEAVPCKCYNKVRRIYCPQCHSNSTTSLFIKKQNSYPQSYKKSLSNNQTNQKNVLLMVTTQLGRKTVGTKTYSALLQLMELPIFSGCLGGVPTKARFLTGRYGEKLSYLDPHHVEDTVGRIQLQKKIDSFHCKDFRVMNRDDLDPQMTICFYLRHLEDLQMLIDTVNKIGKAINENFIKYDWNNDIDIQQQQSIQCKRKLQLHFDQLDQCLSDRSSNMDSSFFMD